MKILVAYDGSDAANAALDLACVHAQALSAHILIITSIEGSTASYGKNLEEAKNELNNVGRRVLDKGVSAETQLLSRGFKAGEDIVKFSKEENVDLIYIGIKKKSKMDKLLFGSNAQFIILSASCPVITVK